MSIRRQCELLCVNRSSHYYEAASETEENLALMKRIDELYLKCPFYGSRKMATALSTAERPINRKRVQRLMRLMGIEAIYQKPKTTQRNAQHKIYPYLLGTANREHAVRTAVLECDHRMNDDAQRPLGQLAATAATCPHSPQPLRPFTTLFSTYDFMDRGLDNGVHLTLHTRSPDQTHSLP